MAIVYRVEDKRGTGAYRCGLASIGIEGYGDDEHEGLHPLPTNDAGLRSWWVGCNTDRYFFGFDTVELYQRWFMWPELRAKMQERGGVLSVYEAPDCYTQVGQFQVAFRRDLAVKLGEMPLSTTAACWESFNENGS